MIQASHQRRLRKLIAKHFAWLHAKYPQVYRRITTHEITLLVREMNRFEVPMGAEPISVTTSKPDSSRCFYSHVIHSYIGYIYRPTAAHIGTEDPTPPQVRSIPECVPSARIDV